MVRAFVGPHCIGRASARTHRKRRRGFTVTGPRHSVSYPGNGVDQEVGKKELRCS